MEITRRDLLRIRLAGQRLIGSLASDPVSLVREQGAVQAQDYSGAKWALGLRVERATDTAIEAVIDSGRILRTHVLRPTWHFVAAQDIRWMLALTAPHVKKTMATYDMRLGITPKIMAKSIDAMARALEGGVSLTRGEIAAVLTRARIKDARTQRLAHLMMGAELEGVVCSGPRRGRDATYALVEDRTPPAPAVDRDQSLGEMARRYFTTRGPATQQDFSWWSGLRAPDARRAIEIAGAHFSSASYDNATVWFSERPSGRSAAAHLLPNYDEYFIGHRDRSAIGRRVRSIQEVAGNQFFAHLVFVNGELVGGWKRVPAKTGIAVKFTMVAKLSAAERRLVDKAVSRLGRFLGAQVEAS